MNVTRLPAGLRSRWYRHPRPSGGSPGGTHKYRGAESPHDGGGPQPGLRGGRRHASRTGAQGGASPRPAVSGSPSCEPGELPGRRVASGGPVRDRCIHEPRGRDCGGAWPRGRGSGGPARRGRARLSPDGDPRLRSNCPPPPSHPASASPALLAVPLYADARARVSPLGDCSPDPPCSPEPPPADFPSHTLSPASGTWSPVFFLLKKCFRLIYPTRDRTRACSVCRNRGARCVHYLFAGPQRLRRTRPASCAR